MKTSQKKELIDKVRRWLKEQRSDRFAIAQANAVNSNRRGRIIKRHRSRLLNSLLSKANVDTKKIERLHENDLKSMRRHLDSQQQTLIKNSAKFHKQLDREIRRIRSSPRRFVYEKGNPMLLTCLWFADDINISPALSTGTGVNIVGSVARGNSAGANTAKVSLSADANGDWYPTVAVTVDFTFIWQSDRQGWLSAESWVYPNGIYRLEAPSDCSGDSVAAAYMSATLSLAQDDADGRLFPLGQSPTAILVNDAAEGYSSWGHGTIGGTIPSERVTRFVDLSGTQRVPILSGFPLVTVISVHMSVSASDNGSASLDCRSGNFDLTVPSVWLVVQS